MTLVLFIAGAWMSGCYAGICWGKRLKRQEIVGGLEVCLHNGKLRREVDLHDSGQTYCSLCIQ